jgi:hypothetical protein
MSASRTPKDESVLIFEGFIGYTLPPPGEAARCQIGACWHRRVGWLRRGHIATASDDPPGSVDAGATDHADRA